MGNASDRRYREDDRGMGSEIIYPVGAGLKWGLLIFLCLSLIYALIFSVRRAWVGFPTLLRTILYFFGVMLSVPSALCAFLTLSTLLVTLFGKFDPPSDRFLGIGAVIVVDGIVVAAWWGLGLWFRHLDRSLQPEARL